MTCGECDYLKRETPVKGRALYVCGRPGERQGRAVASVPDWCTRAQIWSAPAWCGEKGEGHEKDEKDRVPHDE